MEDMDMPDYEKLYRIVFNGITDALEAFEKEGYESAKEMLIKAQQAAEDYYIESGGDSADDGEYAPLYVLPHDQFLNGASL
jgi:hypothetical protein